LGSPLANPLVVTSAFDPKAKHGGVDYRAATGDTVIAPADGKIKIVGNDSRILPKRDPRSGKFIKGWGRFVLLEHTDGSQTLYGHLLMDSVGPNDQGKIVKKGDPIAKANNSGGSSASHLHMEYAPNGKFFNGGKKIDPHPCIGANVSGSITVRDNGTAADDAFRVSLDGTVLGTTAIGASNTFAVNNIRAGMHTLAIVCTIAPDDVGTYEVTLSQGLTFSGGGTSRSGTLTQGGTITFTINAPAT
jgi:murein DD-endopeptidase MepM/ murein hydrolase activator NlpD